ncbi:MAG: DUF1800 domain-containing protein [Pseudomonadota bacterium]
MQHCPRRLRHLSVTIIFCFAVAIVSGCGGGGDGAAALEPPPSASPPPAPTPPTPAPPADPPPPAPPPAPLPPSTESTFATESTTARFLTQATFGPTPADVSRLTGTSAAAWVRAEIAKPASLLMPPLRQYRATLPDNDRPFLLAETTTFNFWKNAIAGDDQLRQRMAFALSQILVVSNAGGEVLTDIPDGVAYFEDVLITHAFGNYRELLEAVTYAPAMGYYLTYLGNQRADPVTGRMPDENYAREILQLFTIGLVELNPDGTERLDSNGRPVETYSNRDVTGLAKVFTGLDIQYEGPGGFEDSVQASWSRPMEIDESIHSADSKAFLGTTIPPATPAAASIDLALDAIFAHPNVAPFVGRQLIQRFTTSNPSPAYVQRVAAVFEAGVITLPDGSQLGTGRRGDLGATLAAILFDAEARDPQALTSDRFGKVREPVIRFTNWARAFNVGTITPELTPRLWSTEDPGSLAQHPYRSPSVFNFFRPGYVAPGSESAAAGLVAPELQLVNASSTAGYANFISDFALGERTAADVAGLREIFTDEGALLDPNGALTSFLPDYTAELAVADNATQLIDLLDRKLTYSSMSTATKAALVQTVSSLPAGDAAARQDRVALAISLAMMTPDYLVQR